MSSILDALRKLDEQKSVRRQPQVDVARGVVRGTTPPPGMRVRPWQLGVALMVVALLSTAITFWATRQPWKSPVQPPQPPAGATAVPQAAPATPAQASAVPTTQQQPVASRPSPAKPRTATPTPVPMPLPAKRAILAPAVTPVPAPATQATTAPLAEPALVEAPRPAVAPPVPSLKVTGIGWQKDAASRYAVINGTAVGEGGSVDGARVEEILPDKVRLKTGDRVIELGLGK
jgi:cytoskeletal protein RodZ